MTRAYYNEIDPYAAQWLRNLIAAGLIADGDVDERSIVDIEPRDLSGYGQCHFFAGIGGWSYALRLAGWPDAEPVWTGSCPCQPLSGAGQRKGHADERHLWPAFYGLIAERAPAVVFGEQVASPLGREWLSGIRADLETLGLACGAADLSAAGVGAPQMRQRIYWVASAASEDDRRAEPRSIARQKPQSRGRLFPRDDPGREIRIAGRPLPNPSLPLLAHGIPHRLDQYRAFGNAIVPQVAAEFIGAYLDVMSGRDTVTPRDTGGGDG